MQHLNRNPASVPPGGGYDQDCVEPGITTSVRLDGYRVHHGECVPMWCSSKTGFKVLTGVGVAVVLVRCVELRQEQHVENKL